MNDVTQSLYAIPGKWLHELLALCGPEDHELRERIRAALAAAPQAPAAPKAMPTDAELQALSRECAKMSGGMGMHYLNYGREILTRWGSAPAAQAAVPQAPAAPSTRAGLLAAAEHIQAKAQAYAEEFGSYDPDTGAVELGDVKQEYFNTLDELAEEIRLMADKAHTHPPQMQE
mgnify:CR=1 FL=1